MLHLYSRISVRTKMIFIVAGTLIMAITIIGFLIKGLVYQNIVSQKMTTVDILTASIVHDIKFVYKAQRRESVQGIIAKFMTYYRIIQNISFYNTDLVNIADSQEEYIGRTTRDPDVLAAILTARPSVYITNSDLNNFRIRSVSPILQGSKIVGAVALDTSIKDIQDILWAIEKHIAAILVISVFITSAVLFILLRSCFLQRLTRLITVTQQIAGGNYNVQLLDTQKDEIGKLTQAFDLMAIDLRKSKQQIEEDNKDLEKRVQEATSQLTKTYEDLKNAQGQLVLNEKMASLGILIAGIAHELNTPIGSILNVSRSLEKKIDCLPRVLEEFKKDTHLSITTTVACLEDMIQTFRSPNQSLSFSETRKIENLLRDHGIGNFKEMANSLSRLNIADSEKIIRYIDCFKMPSFFSLVESLGSIIQSIRISETSSQKIAEIVRALKYYAYTDKDKTEMIQINESIQTALILLRSRIKHTVTVSTEMDPDLPPIPCTSEIHQVWTNLLNNACDAIEEMGEDHEGKVLIHTHKEDPHILISITDNGIGIPEDHIKKIFDPFFTTKDIGKGTGLGLSIVSGILRKHNGTLQVESRRGHTVFEIALPIVNVPILSGERDAVSTC